MTTTAGIRSGIGAWAERFEALCARIAGRSPDRGAAPGAADLSVSTLLGTIGVGGAIFGCVMGTYLVAGPGRWPLVLFAAVKVPTLILLTTAVCLPAFFVLNTVLGLRESFSRAVRAVLAGQAGLALGLASLAPLVRVAYECGISHQGAQLLCAGMFVLATAAGQTVMLRRYRGIIDADPVNDAKHRTMLWTWVTMYVFTGIQTGWILRPYIGAPGLDVRFLRPDAFSNAYVYFLKLVLG